MKTFPSLSDDLARWALRQPVFFTASAPTHGAHVNVSPKGLSAHFAVFSPTRVAYIDRTGSGCETISHSYENGRLTIMFMSFGPAPRILRLFCRSTVVEYDDPRFEHLVLRVGGGKRAVFDGARAVILCDVFEVTTSCGYGVPMVRTDLFASASEDDDGNELSVFVDRPTLDVSAEKKTHGNTMHEYQRQNNVHSLDGLPGLRTARRDAGQWLLFGDVCASLRNVVAVERGAVALGFLMATVFYFITMSLVGTSFIPVVHL